MYETDLKTIYGKPIKPCSLECDIYKKNRLVEIVNKLLIITCICDLNGGEKTVNNQESTMITFREDLKRYNVLVEQSPDWIFACNLHGDFIFVNKSTCRGIGYTKKELLGMSVFDLIPKDYVTQYRDRLSFIQSGKKLDKPMEYEVIDKNGKTHCIEVRSAPITKNKHIVGFQAIAQDVTKHREMERLIQEEEEKYRNLVNNAIVGIYKTNLNGDFLFANKALANMLGFKSPNSLISTDVRSLYNNPEDRDAFVDAITKKGMVSNYEVDLKTKKKKVKHVLISGYIEQNVISGMIVDITDRKLAEIELIESKNFLNDMFESIQDGISVLDTSFRITQVNKVMEGWYEKNLPLVGKQCYNAYHNRDTSCENCPTVRCFASGSTEFEIVPGLPGSPVKWVELFSYPVKNQKGELTGVVEFVRDVTERKNAEEELRTAYARLESSLEREIKFKLDTAHYFFNPLCIARGYMELAREENRLDFLEKAFVALGRLESVVKNITQKGEVRE